MTGTAGSPTASGASPGLVIVKLGGSLITDKERPQTARPQVIQRLAQEIAEAQGAMPGQLLLGHGSGSFGHVAAAECGLGKGPFTAPDAEAVAHRRRGMAVTQDQAARLHRLLVAALLDSGSTPYGWAASSALSAQDGVPSAGHLQPLLQALRMGLLPVVYGDVVQDAGWGAAICSTESLISFLVEHLQRAGLRIHRLLWCGETDGIYDRSGRTIERVDGENLSQVRGQIEAARGVDVTGGMGLRLDTCRALARRGVESWLLNGLTPGHLKSALLGDEVTATRFPVSDAAGSDSL